MKSIVNEVACKLRDSLLTQMDDFQGLYVFGSQIRGEATDRSDIDIVVLFNQDYFRLPDALFEILFDIGIEYYDLIDLDVHTETLNSLKLNPFLYDEVVNKGVFYGAV